jgi:hypothetical protein
VNGSDELYGFGTWKHRDVQLKDSPDPMRVIDVPYFGVQERYQGETDLHGAKLARRLFVTLEAAARSHPESDDGTPMHLVCDVKNDRGQRFWQSLAFVEVEPLVFEDVTYSRMIRR